MTASQRVVVFDPGELVSDSHSRALASRGFQVERFRDEALASSAFDGPPFSALIVVEGESPEPGVRRLLKNAREHDVPVLAIIRHAGDLDALRDRVQGYDAWVDHGGPPDEVVIRLENTLAVKDSRQSGASQTIPIDARMLAMIVHDVRNPLNVIGLTLRVLDQIPGPIRNEIHEDLIFLRDNAAQIEKILLLLSEYCRLVERKGELSPAAVEPKRFIEEVLDERAHKSFEKAFPARFEAEASTPQRVAIDPIRARVALLCALANAAGAADRPIVVRTRGGEGRWIIEIDIERNPPPTVAPFQAEPGVYERMIGSSAERRGLDLALAAWISKQLHGTVRLEVVPDQKSSIVIDWPVE